MTLEELPSRMSEEEFIAWRAFDQYVQPIGDQRLARQLALQSTLFANVHRPKDREPFTLDEMDLAHPSKYEPQAPPSPSAAYIAGLRRLGVFRAKGEAPPEAPPEVVITEP